MIFKYIRWSTLSRNRNQELLPVHRDFIHLFIVGEAKNNWGLYSHFLNNAQLFPVVLDYYLPKNKVWLKCLHHFLHMYFLHDFNKGILNF